jgi:hypothetical protein
MCQDSDMLSHASTTIVIIIGCSAQLFLCEATACRRRTKAAL